MSFAPRIKLALRVAHLLGNDSESRKQIVRQVKDLYKVRSQIVHSGKFRVADVDLQQIKLLTKKCILRILGDEIFLSIKLQKSLRLGLKRKSWNKYISISRGRERERARMNDEGGRVEGSHPD